MDAPDALQDGRKATIFKTRDAWLSEGPTWHAIMAVHAAANSQCGVLVNEDPWL